MSTKSLGKVAFYEMWLLSTVTALLILKTQTELPLKIALWS